MNPMVPFLTGWLAGLLLRDGKEAMKILCLDRVDNQTLAVAFASGLVVRVKVEVACDPRGAGEGG